MFHKVKLVWVCIFITGVVLGSLGVGAALAQNPGIIYGAIQKNNGQLRIINDPSEVKNSENLISWNKEGPAGPAGTNGVSIIWLGTLTSAPSNPTLNNAYYDSTNKKSYIWDGNSWEILAQDGTASSGGTTSGFGSWEAKWFYNSSNAPGNIYQAATDGLVVAYAPVLDFRGLDGLTGQSGDQMTKRIAVYSSATQYSDKVAITMPVKKGDYWCVIAAQYRDNDGRFDAKVSWIPLGN